MRGEPPMDEPQVRTSEQERPCASCGEQIEIEGVWTSCGDFEESEEQLGLLCCFECGEWCHRECLAGEDKMCGPCRAKAQTYTGGGVL